MQGEISNMYKYVECQLSIPHIQKFCRQIHFYFLLMRITVRLLPGIS